MGSNPGSDVVQLAELKKNIEIAFSARVRPENPSILKPDDGDYDIVERLMGINWNGMRPSELEHVIDISAFWNPHGFAYFLPKLLILSLEQTKAMLGNGFFNEFIDELMLPSSEFKAGYHAAKYELLRGDEMKAFQQWAIWLAQSEFAQVREEIGRNIDNILENTTPT